MNIQGVLSVTNSSGSLGCFDCPDLDFERLAELTTIPESRVGGPVAQIGFRQVSDAALTPLLQRMIDISKSSQPIAALSQVWRRDMLPLLAAEQQSLWITNIMTTDPDQFVLILDRDGIWLDQSRFDSVGESLHTHVISLDKTGVKLRWNGEESDVCRISELLLKLDDVANDLQIGRIVALNAPVPNVSPQLITESEGGAMINVSLKNSIRIRSYFGMDHADLDRIVTLFSQQLLEETSRGSSSWNGQLRKIHNEFLAVCQLVVDGRQLGLQDASTAKGLLIYLKMIVGEESANRDLIELVKDVLESLNITPIPSVNMVSIRNALEKISKSPIVGQLKKMEVPLDRWKTRGWADPRDQFLKSHFFKAELLDGGSRTYTGIMLSQSEFERFQVRSKTQVDSTLSYDTALGQWEFCRHLDSDHIQEKTDVVDRIVRYIDFLNEARGPLAFLKEIVAKQYPDEFMIYNGDGSLAGVDSGAIVGTEYLYRTHYNHIGNVWHMSKMANSTEKGSDLGVWMEEVWVHRAAFRRYVLVDGVSTTLKIWDLLDKTEIFYKLEMDERIRPEFQGQHLSRVLKRYMKTDAKQMVGVRHMHEKMEATLALGYAARRLEKDARGEDKRLLTECATTLEKDPFKKIRAKVRQIGQKVLGSNPEIKRNQPDHDVNAFERNSSPESGSSDTDLVPRSTFKALEVERDLALQTAEQERQEKLKERQERLKERQEKQDAIQRVHQEQKRAHQERERADALQRQLDELLGARIAGKKRTGSEMDGSDDK